MWGKHPSPEKMYIGRSNDPPQLVVRSGRVEGKIQKSTPPPKKLGRKNTPFEELKISGKKAEDPTDVNQKTSFR